MLSALAEDFDAVFERVDAARLVELLDRDGTGGVEEAAVDPVLDLVEVERHVGGSVDVGEAAFRVTSGEGGLTTFEPGHGFAVASARFLALVTASTCAAASGGGTATESFALSEMVKRTA